ncbi:hypothetical protein HMI59_22985 (plasmid) [Paenarthrobacter sp. YJN-5]|nr:hypothetical protein HMI59_22985 [Paenarthrobacter sp. YJN-5]
MRGEVPESVWAAIEAEFTLPSLEQVQQKLGEQTADPEPLLRRLVRVFIGEGTYCPGFQFTAAGGLHPAVTGLFERAMELKIPHDYFTPWMITPSTDLQGARPVDLLNDPLRLGSALEVFARR